jgi:two-component system OmpR family response regulator
MPAPSRLVAVVDENETLREAVCRAIRVESHRASAYGGASVAREAFERALPDCVVVSMGVADDAAGLCRWLRQRSPTVPLVVAVKSEQDMDAVAALNLGADDYITKPFSIKELWPRLRVLIRRAGLSGAEPLAWEDRPVTIGALTVDPLRLSTKWNDKPVALTVTEFFVLHALVGRVGVVKTRDQLLQDAFPGRSAGDGMIDRIVKRIQEKFDALEPGFDNLEGVHGAGYRYRAARRRA